MPSDGDPRVAVVGAAGFVGRELLRRLEKIDIRVTAVVRGLPELSMDGDFHDCCSPSAALACHGFDVVVNLAYPTSGSPYEHPPQDAAIVRTVGGLVKDGGRIIQASTLAVFGLAVDREVQAGPVSAIRDAAYVESKVTAERLLTQRQVKCGLSLDIVRLGNVWGYSSGSWTLPVVQRLLTGRPVGVAGTPGYSNATDVANAAAYFTFLIQGGPPGTGVRYHHLAEFSAVRWTEWAEPIAGALGVEVVYADPSNLESPETGRQELTGVLAPLAPLTVYRKLATERIAGSWTRTLVRRLPAPARSRLKPGAVFAEAPEPDRSEQTFLAIMAGKQEFRSVIDSGWKPELTKDESVDRVLLWLDGG